MAVWPKSEIFPNRENISVSPQVHLGGYLASGLTEGERVYLLLLNKWLLLHFFLLTSRELPFPNIHKILLTSPLFPPILLILTPLFCDFLIVSAGRRYKILNPILTADSTPDMLFIKRENIEAIDAKRTSILNYEN
jgi:hypothetical protein